MALRMAPDARVIGTDSNGTDGNIAIFSLPGGIEIQLIKLLRSNTINIAKYVEYVL